MNWKGALRIVGTHLYLLAAILFVGFIVASYYQFMGPLKHLETPCATAFLFALFAAAFSGFTIRKATVYVEKQLDLREAILAVILVWVSTVFFAALPFTLSGVLEHSIDAWFEVVSGITTTGSTILHPKAYNSLGKEIPIHKMFTGFQAIEYSFYGTIKPIIDPITHKVLYTGIEAVPRALHIWRALLQWYGGIGIVFLFVALLPALGQRARVLFRYESTGPSFQPLFPRARETVLALIQTYCIFTFACIALLFFTNRALSLFDLITISFSTISTGGFPYLNSSIASYNSVATEIIVMIFMIIGAMNFTTLYDILRGRFARLFEPECLVFLGILLMISVFAALNIYHSSFVPLETLPHESNYGIGSSIRYGFFQIISALTTTGFATVDYDKWPFFAQSIMLICMYFGGMAGSTAGGLKIIRLVILFKSLRYSILSLFRRSEVKILRVGERIIDEETVRGVLNFFLVTVVCSIIGVHLMILSGVDLETSLGLNAATINNSGSSFRMAGPQESCAFLSPFGKLICIAWMLLGRLEYYAWLTLLLPVFWKNK